MLNKKTEDIKIGFLNIQGGRRQGKWEEIAEEANMSGLSMLCVSETHLREEEKIPHQEGWKWKGQNRGNSEKRGGGIGMMYLEKVNGKLIKKCEEHMWFKLETPEEDILIGLVYLATGNSGETENWNREIFNCIQKDICEMNKGNIGSIIIGGDFNAYIIELADTENKNGGLMKDVREIT